jgi:cupin superfamily acireductone dioxygenase involved in methionine salvage
MVSFINRKGANMFRLTSGYTLQEVIEEIQKKEGFLETETIQVKMYLNADLQDLVDKYSKEKIQLDKMKQ